jgi:hypothetical protein
MSMMEEGDETLGLEREICWLSEQAEMWLDRIGRAITEPAHVDRLARTIAPLADIERGKRESLCSSQPIGWRRSRRASPPYRSVAFDWTSRACGLRSTG